MTTTRLQVVAIFLVVAGAVGLVATPTRAAQNPELPDILAAAGRYLADFGRHADGVVIEEDYVQVGRARVVQAQRMRADLAFLADPSFGWIEFRDVIDVDGKPVADRETRAVDLFADPDADALEHVRRIIREGARFNLAPVGLALDRTTNVPTAALRFFTRDNQRRSHMRRDGFDNVGGGRTAVVHFTEESRPRLIGTPDDAAATGTAWIEPATGQVRRTSLRIETRRGGAVTTATMRVEFGPALDLAVWLPRRMEETIVITTGTGFSTEGSVSGQATYRNYRKFNVTLDEKAARPDGPRPGAR
jgi:hypothetical protein